MPSPSPELEKDKNISELLTKSETSLVSKNFEEAISGCRAILTISPDNQRARELLDEAQSKLEAELFIKENLRKADEFFRIRDFQKCINECQKIQLLDAENPAVIEVMNKAQDKLEAEPFVQNFINSGRSLFESGLYDEAIAQWEKVRGIDPEYPDLDRLINNARLKMSSGADDSQTAPMFDLSDHAKEESAESFGFVSDQDRIQQLLDEGDRLYSNHQYQKAIEVWSEIFMLDVNHPQALEKIEQARAAAADQRLKIKDILKNAQVAYEQGDVSQARDLFLDVKEIDPENSEANKYLNLIERADNEPQSLQDLLSRGELAEKQGQYREAAQFFSQALAVDSENASLADKIRNLNLLAKKQEQAKAFLGNARAFIAEGKYDSARHALSKILETDPGNQEVLDLLQEIKDKVSTLSAASAGTTAGATVAVRKGFPVIPAAIGGGLLAILAAGYFWFFPKDEPNAQAYLPIKRAIRPVGKAPGQPEPGQNVNPTAKGPMLVVSEDKKEKAARLFKEANFYFNEKQYPEALKKAEEALEIDPENKDLIGLKLQSEQKIREQLESEQKQLDDANSYFGYSEFAAAVKLYEEYLDRHAEAKDKIMPQILKCYYNLGILSAREWRCDTAADYFRQVLFLDETDQLSKDALAIARRCQKSGTADIEVRKALTLMEIRR